MMNPLLNRCYLIIIIIIINNQLLAFCQKQDQRIYKELITNPITFTPKYSKIINHSDLPFVKDELSVTFKINLSNHGTDWATIFHKGRTAYTERTPSLWLSPNLSSLYPRFSITNDGDVGLAAPENESFLLNRWYHITYTISDPEKRMDIYVDGKWTAYKSVDRVQTQNVVFNDGPLYIGKDPFWDGITGQISNFRYYNFRLSPSEVLLDYSGEDPTKSNGTTGASNNCITAATVTAAAEAAPATDNELSCPKTSEILAGAIIGSFLFGGIVFMAGSFLFLRKSTKRKIFEDDGVNNQVVSAQM